MLKRLKNILSFSCSSIIAVIIFFLFYTDIVFAVKQYTPKFTDPLTEPWQWTSFPELSGKGIYCMTESSDGSLWFGGDEGVIHYNGTDWKLHSTDKEKKLFDSPVISIFAASDGSIYTGKRNGVSRFRDGEWQHLSLPVSFNFEKDPLPEFFIGYSIIESSDGSIWIGAIQGALQIKNDRWILYSGDEIIPIKPGDEQHQLSMDYPVFNIYEDRDNVIWFGLKDGKVVRTDIRNGYSKNQKNWRVFTENDGLLCQRYPQLYQTFDGIIWVINADYSDRGISRYDGKKWSYFTQEEFGGTFNNYSIMQTQDGSVWVGGYSKLHIYKNSKWHVYKAPDFPIPVKHIILYNQINTGVVWIAGLRSNIVSLTYETNRWVNFKELNFYCESLENIQWFISANGRVISFEPRKQQWLSYGTEDGLMDSPVQLISTERGIWAAGSHQNKAAVAFFDGKKWNHTIHGNLSWGIDYRSVFEAQDGSIWFGAMEMKLLEQLGGVIRYESSHNNLNRAWTHYTPPNVREAVQQISQTPDGQLWFGCHDLFHFDGEKLFPVVDYKKYTESNTHFLFSTRDGDLWISCRGYGVLQYDGAEWYHYDKSNGLSGNIISSIVQSFDGSILVNTENGISRFDGKTWTTQVIPNSIKAGRAEGCVLRYSSDGALWINNSSRDWLRRSQPDKYTEEKVYKEYYTIRYQPTTAPPETIIKSHVERVSSSGNVTFLWKGIDHWHENRSSELEYSYRLDDHPFGPFTTNTYHTFFSLASGEHSLEVQARDLDLNVDKTPARIEFYVVPPLYKQWPFIGLVCFILGIVIYYEIRIRRRNKIIHLQDMSRIRLFTNISHELRTPLSLIKGPLDKLLSLKDEKDSGQDLLYLMQHNVQRLLHLVNQTLEFQKLNIEKEKQGFIETDIIQFARNIFDSFIFQIQEKQIKYEFLTECDTLSIKIDVKKIDSILSNLISNAIKYTPRNGEITVKLKRINKKQTNQFIKYLSNLWNSSNYKKYLEIIVADTGIGIEEDKIKYIFDPFFRGNELKSNEESAGIGLAFTKELVNSLKGKIFVQSQPGKGSQFTVVLPLHETINHKLQKNEESNRGFENSVSIQNMELENKENLTLDQNEKPSILVVEDNPQLRQWIASELAEIYNIYKAENGKQGIKVAFDKIPDLIISDIMMPEMSGYELCSSIKSDLKTSHIPVILLTALASNEHEIEGLEAKADDYIKKPVDMNVLKAHIRTILLIRRELRKRFSGEIHLQPSDITITNLDEEFLKKAMNIVENHLNDPEFNTEALSREIGISRSNLYRKLTSITDLKPSEFIRFMRLKVAAQLLENSQLTVTEICYQVGFNHLSRFFLYFKKQFGTSPNNYRKQN